MCGEILSAIIGGSIAIVTFSVGLVFQFIRERAERKYRLMHDLLPDRIETHQKMIADVSELGVQEFYPNFKSVPELEKHLSFLSVTLKQIGMKSVLRADTQLSGIIFSMAAMTKDLELDVIQNTEIDPNVIFIAFQEGYTTLFQKLLKAGIEKSGLGPINKAHEEFLNVALKPLTREKKVKNNPTENPTKKTGK